MEEETFEADLQLAHARQAVQLHVKEVPVTDSQEQIELQAAIKKGVEASQRWPQSRSARVERLRAMVEAGTYQVNSTALAESILKNDTRFFEAH
jgi:anti-sigma28 factor (negative regulator of flagellin synthesis)